MHARTRRWVSALFSDGDDAGDDDLIPRLVEQVRHSFTFHHLSPRGCHRDGEII
jgi:hypothetical protein